MGYFNPRTPVGCDDRPRGGPPAMFISIHAPQWGATMIIKDYYPVLDISIHAPQWGATARRLPSADLRVISIHAPQWGATIQR